MTGHVHDHAPYRDRTQATPSGTRPEPSRAWLPRWLGPRLAIALVVGGLLLGGLVLTGLVPTNVLLYAGLVGGMALMHLGGHGHGGHGAGGGHCGHRDAGYEGRHGGHGNDPAARDENAGLSRPSAEAQVAESGSSLGFAGRADDDSRTRETSIDDADRSRHGCH